jgi:DNA-binding HxlR family transcriptional regulator
MMSDSVEEFFRKNGAIGLILTIGTDGARFKEIVEQVVVSHDTLSNRIDEARDIGLIETEEISDIGTSFTNTLTDSGEICYYIMLDSGLADSYMQYISAIKEYNKLSREFTQQVEDESEWLDWILNEGDRLLEPWRIFETEALPPRFPSDPPEAIEKAVQEKSIDPLEDLEYEDFWLWMLTYYPPKPDNENRPPQYRTKDQDKYTER